MALIHCPECAATVSEAASACPQCGYELTPDVVETQKEQEAKDARKNTILQVIALGGGLAIALVLINLFGTSQQSRQDYDNPAMAITMAKSFVRDHLKSPSSASFPWSFDEYQASSSLGGKWTVSGYVDAVNGFNANIRTPWSLEMKDEGRSWRLLSIYIGD